MLEGGLSSESCNNFLMIVFAVGGESFFGSLLVLTFFSLSSFLLLNGIIGGGEDFFLISLFFTFGEIKCIDSRNIGIGKLMQTKNFKTMGTSRKVINTSWFSFLCYWH